MAPHRDDALTGVLSRRSLLASLSVSPVLATVPGASEARRKRRKKKRLCLDGQTIPAPRNRKKRRKLRRRGASRGPCPTCTPVWAPQTTFGSAGSDPDQFDDPHGVAVARDGLTLWVGDTFNHRIAIWSRADGSSPWTHQTTFGSYGSDPDQFRYPYGVAVSRNGLNMWVADYSNHRISVWTRPTAASTAWTHQTTFGSYGSNPDQFGFPSSVAVARDSLTLWVADTENSRISIWTRPTATSTDWSPQTTFGSAGTGETQLLYPYGVDVAGNALTMWVADTGNNRIAIWTRPTATSTDWSPQTTVGGGQGSGADQFETPYGVDIAGNALAMWVADTGNNRISVWTRPTATSTDWSPQTTFGSKGSGADQFDTPYGVAHSSDALTLWITDSANNRISIWEGACP